MPNTTSDRPAYISSEGESVSCIIVPLSQLDTVTSLLDANDVPYWVDEESLSIDGKPEVTFINLDDRSDPENIRRLLDSIP